MEDRAPGAVAGGRTSSTVIPEDRRLERGIRELAAMLLTETSVERTLADVTTLAAAGIPGCDAASVTLLENGRLSTPVSSGEVAVDLDQAQYATRRGPCLDAVQHGDVVRVDSFASDDRWPELAARAAARGIASSLSVPLAVADQVLGALNLYSGKARAFADAQEQACLLGHQASITLANACAMQRAEQLTRQLARALENRDVIGQAKGIIMAGQNVSSDEAFDVLRRASQRANRKLSDVAGDIVERRNADLRHAGPAPADPAGNAASPAEPGQPARSGLRSRSGS